jgi:hypothetical protein
MIALLVLSPLACADIYWEVENFLPAPLDVAPKSKEQSRNADGLRRGVIWTNFLVHERSLLATDTRSAGLVIFRARGRQFCQSLLYSRLLTP